MSIYEFMALFSFSFILFTIIGIFVLGFISVRKKKKTIAELNSLRNSILNSGGFNNEIKEDN